MPLLLTLEGYGVPVPVVPPTKGIACLLDFPIYDSTLMDFSYQDLLMEDFLNQNASIVIILEDCLGSLPFINGIQLEDGSGYWLFEDGIVIEWG